MNKFFKRMTAVFLAVSTTAASILMPATGIYAAETAATTQNTQAAQTTQNSQNTQTTKNTQEYDWPQAPDIVAQSAILIDADTGAILYEKSAAANSVTYEDASLGTKTGEQYSVEQALYGLLLYSANEIAYGLAEHVSGSLAAFTELMNKRAKELGAINTHFANASGLHDVNHYTTAYDMAMIAKGCYNNSTFVNIDSTSTTYTIPPTNKTDTARNFKHRHLMLKGRQYYYEYCKGGKTGFTDQAGYTLVTFAEKDDMRLICVCFKSGDKERFTDTRSLFDWGFANFKKITASGGTISSLFTSDSYYQSPVFNKYNLKFNLKASTLTLPNNASVGNVAMGIDNNYKTTSENGIYTAHLNFNYGNNIVGTAKLTLSSDENIAAASNLPFAKDDNNYNLKQKQCIVINIWVIVAVIAAILIVLYIHSEVKRRKTQRRRYSGRKYL